MSNTLEAVSFLEKALKKLLFNYDFLKKENDILLQKTTNLQEELLKTTQLYQEQKQEYNLLKIAKTIEGSTSNTKETKLKINALIREIDTCIVQLNE